MGKFPISATINGGKGNDRISAGAGNDVILGSGGDDYIFGGDGKDTVDGGSQGDDMFGGGGKDTIDYSARTAPLVIGLGTLPDDGESGEGDNVRTDFEIVLGGAASDKISHGGTRPINLYGNAGNDTLIGGVSDDFLVGGAGTDSLAGNGGVDTFDVLDNEKDTVNGGDGADNVKSSDKNDILDSIK
jgi:Ca2+-binding RTX toxin-like protein